VIRLVSMARRMVIVALLACFVAAARTAEAQAVNLGPAPRIAGVVVSCAGAPAVAVADFQDMAYAANGTIILRADFFRVPGVVQLFIYAHECAHLVVVGGSEPGADCWAIKIGRDQGWIDQDGLATVMRFFGRSPGDWSHEPGTARIRRMAACFENP
jgi:hypothetical protein